MAKGTTEKDSHVSSKWQGDGIAVIEGMMIDTRNGAVLGEYNPEEKKPETSDEDILKEDTQAEPTEKTEDISTDDAGNDDDHSDSESETKDTTTEEDKSKEVKVKVIVQGEEQEVSLEELRQGYMRNADYTKKTQEAAAKARQIEQERLEIERMRLEAEERSRAKPDQPPVDKISQWRTLHEIITEQTCQDLGISRDDFDMDINPEHRLAYDMAKQEILEEYKGKKTAETNQKAVENWGQRTLETLKAEEPRFDELLAFAADVENGYYSNLPHRQVVAEQRALADALSKMDMDGVRQQYERIRKVFYGKGKPKEKEKETQKPKDAVAPLETLKPGSGQDIPTREIKRPTKTEMNKWSDAEIQEHLKKIGAADL